MNILRKELKIWPAAILSGLLMALVITNTRAYSESIQREISRNVIRFHVIAGSDEKGALALKDIIRDEVLEYFGGKLDPESGIEDTRAFLLEHLEDIQKYAAGLIYDMGYDYSVRTELGKVFFPTRIYGNMAFPAGVYEALRIIIEEGYGSNWWCIMFPPLCYVDAAMPYDGGYTLLGALLSDEVYAVINYSQGGAGVRVRFRIVEWWQERMHG